MDDTVLIENSKKKKKSFHWTDLLILLLIGVMLFSGYKVWESLRGYQESKQEYDGLIEDMTREPKYVKNHSYHTFDYDGLRHINSDFIYWLDVPGTVISYPVVQGQDNDYYLRRTFAGKWNVGGVIFMDAYCNSDLNDRNTIIYGHRMYDGSMFADLRRFMESDYFHEHTEIHLYNDAGVYIYKIFAASRVDIYGDWPVIDLDDDSVYAQWLANQKANSVYDSGITPSTTDKVLTLATCVGNGFDDERYIVQAIFAEFIPLD